MHLRFFYFCVLYCRVVSRSVAYAIVLYCRVVDVRVMVCCVCSFRFVSSPCSVVSLRFVRVVFPVVYVRGCFVFFFCFFFLFVDVRLCLRYVIVCSLWYFMLGYFRSCYVIVFSFRLCYVVLLYCSVSSCRFVCFRFVSCIDDYVIVVAFIFVYFCCFVACILLYCRAVSCRVFDGGIADGRVVALLFVSVIVVSCLVVSFGVCDVACIVMYCILFYFRFVFCLSFFFFFFCHVSCVLLRLRGVSWSCMLRSCECVYAPFIVLVCLLCYCMVVYVRD